MFIRKVMKSNKGSQRSYTYYRLVDSYRGPGDTPRQRVILNLGKLESVPEHKHKLLADKIEMLLQGRLDMFPELSDYQIDTLAKSFYDEILGKGTYHHTPVPPAPKKPDSSADADFVRVDLNSMEHGNIREIGAGWMCKQVIEQTGIIGALQNAGIKGDALLQSLIGWTARMVNPLSESATAGWLKKYSAICELYDYRPSQIDRFKLYRASLRLYSHKDLIESHLCKHTQDLFSLEDSIILYDLTNTYFEGVMDGSKRAAHGRSKEKRSDAPLISLALVTDNLGFCKYSRFYDGNVSEPKTLADLLDHLRLRTGHITTRPKIVMDAGIATEANLAMLRGLGYEYFCVSRKKMSDYSAEQADPVLVENKAGQVVEVKHLACDIATKDRMIYVRSPLRIKKDKAIKDNLTRGFIEDLETARSALGKPRGTKAITKVHERIGRLKEKHSRVARHYRIEYTEDKVKGIVTDLQWFFEPAKPEEDEGIYFLRTNNTLLDEKAIWQIYTTLTEIESTFRTLKTDLSIRPVYHQTDHNIEAHLFLGVLAYHIVSIIRYKLKQHNIDFRWKKIIEIMESQKIITTTLKDDKDQIRFTRQCSRPNAETARIYEALALRHQPLTRKKGVVTQL